ETLRVVRVSRRMSSRSSSPRIVWLNADWVTPSTFAARVKLPSRATVTNASKSLRLRRAIVKAPGTDRLAGLLAHLSTKCLIKGSRARQTGPTPIHQAGHGDASDCRFPRRRPWQPLRRPSMLVNAYGAHAGDQPLEPLQIQRRAPGLNDVQIDIAFCGICHSDVHQARGEWAGTQYPCVPGHEIVGRVSAVGAAVTTHRVGDLVGVGCIVDSCKHCSDC